MVATSLPTNESNKPLVQIESLDVDFDRHRVLRGINISISRGQTLAIIGESGCGKTVLLKTMIGLLHPSRGAVYFDGQNLAAMHEKELTRQRIRFGFLFQQAALFDSMTIAQNIAFPLRQHTRKSDEEIQRIISARLVEVGLPESDRIIKASRHSERVALLACGRALASWDQQHLPRLEKVANLTVISIDQAFINKLASLLERSISWSITITEGSLYLTIGEETMEAAIRVKTGNL